MKTQRGQRDKLERHLNVNESFEVVMQVSGPSVYDCTCFCLDEKEKLVADEYMIFYNQTKSPNGEIIYNSGGNRTVFVLNLALIPENIKKLAFTVTIDGSENMSLIQNHMLEIKQNNQTVLELSLNGADFNEETAVVIMELYKKDVWRFGMIANGFKYIKPLEDLLCRYGGEAVQHPNEDKTLVSQQTSNSVKTENQEAQPVNSQTTSSSTKPNNQEAQPVNSQTTSSNTEPKNQSHSHVSSKKSSNADEPKNQELTSTDSQKTSDKKKPLRRRTKSYTRSNMFANIENQFEFATEEEIIEKACVSCGAILEALNEIDYEDKTIFYTLILGAKLGVASDGELNEKEKMLIDTVFDDIWSGSNNDLYNLIGLSITEEDYELVQMIIQLGNSVAMPFLYYILSFAYIDEVFNDEVAERLDGMFGMNLLALFFQSGLEEVPTPEIKLLGLDADIVNWFEEDNTLRKLEEVQEHFYYESKSEVEDSLEYLCDEGVLYKAETYCGVLYGLA